MIHKKIILGNIELLKHFIETEESNKVKVLKLMKRIEKDYKESLKEVRFIVEVIE